MAKRADINKRKGRNSRKHHRNARIATKKGLIKRSKIKNKASVIQKRNKLNAI